ncbi:MULTISPECIES: SirB2 family protein [unclassified Moraxella]|uniref:SirB2 family protein n=1 Tax=unclassified Moraxella TaxID=2685852 RepID=UPI003AF902F7
MKHLHMLMAVLTIAIFVYQFIQIMRGKNAQLPNKGLKIASHVIYTLLLIAGVMTLMPLLKVIGFPHFILAKIILFVVAISTTIKATRLTTPAPQAKAGMLLAMIAYIGIVGLAVMKPMNLF